MAKELAKLTKAELLQAVQKRDGELADKAAQLAASEAKLQQLRHTLDILKEKASGTAQVVEQYQQLAIRFAETDKQLKKERAARIKLQKAAAASSAATPAPSSSIAVSEPGGATDSQAQATPRQEGQPPAGPGAGAAEGAADSEGAAARSKELQRLVEQLQAEVQGERELRQASEQRAQEAAQRAERLQTELQGSAQGTAQARGAYEVQLQHAQQKAEQLGDQLQQERVQRQGVERQLKEAGRKAEQLQVQLHQADHKSERCERELQLSTQKVEDLQGQHRQAEQRAQRLHAELQGAQQRADQLQAELQGSQQRAERLHTEVQGVQQRADQLQAELQGSQQRAEQLQAELQQAEQRAGQLGRELQLSAQRVDELQGQQKQAEQRAEELQRDLDHVRSARQGVEQALQEALQRVEASQAPIAAVAAVAAAALSQAEVGASNGGVGLGDAAVPTACSVEGEEDLEALKRRLGEERRRAEEAAQQLQRERARQARDREEGARRLQLEQQRTDDLAWQLQEEKDRMVDLEKRAAEAQESVGRLEAEVARERALAGEAERRAQQAGELAREREQAAAQLGRRAEEAERQLQDERQRAEDVARRLQQQEQEASQSVQRLEEERQRADREAGELRERCAMQAASVEALEQKVAALAARLQDSEREGDRERQQAAQEAAEQLQQELQGRLQGVLRELKAARSGAAERERRLEEAERAGEELRRRLAAAEVERRGLGERLQGAEDGRREAEGRLNALLDERQQLQDLLSGRRAAAVAPNAGQQQAAPPAQGEQGQQGVQRREQGEGQHLWSVNGEVQAQAVPREGLVDVVGIGAAREGADRELEPMAVDPSPAALDPKGHTSPNAALLEHMDVSTAAARTQRPSLLELPGLPSPPSAQPLDPLRPQAQAAAASKAPSPLPGAVPDAARAGSHCTGGSGSNGGSGAFPHAPSPGRVPSLQTGGPALEQQMERLRQEVAAQGVNYKRVWNELRQCKQFIASMARTAASFGGVLPPPDPEGSEPLELLAPPSPPVLRAGTPGPGASVPHHPMGGHHQGHHAQGSDADGMPSEHVASGGADVDMPVAGEPQNRASGTGGWLPSSGHFPRARRPAVPAGVGLGHQPAAAAVLAGSGGEAQRFGHERGVVSARYQHQSPPQQAGESGRHPLHSRPTRSGDGQWAEQGDGEDGAYEHGQAPLLHAWSREEGAARLVNVDRVGSGYAAWTGRRDARGPSSGGGALVTAESRADQREMLPGVGADDSGVGPERPPPAKRPCLAVPGARGLHEGGSLQHQAGAGGAASGREMGVSAGPRPPALPGATRASTAAGAVVAAAGAPQQVPAGPGEGPASAHASMPGPTSAAGTAPRRTAVLLAPEWLPSDGAALPPPRKRGRPRKVIAASELLLPLTQGTASGRAPTGRTVAAVARKLREALAADAWPREALLAALMNAILACAAPRVSAASLQPSASAHGAAGAGGLSAGLTPWSDARVQSPHDHLSAGEGRQTQAQAALGSPRSKVVHAEASDGWMGWAHPAMAQRGVLQALAACAIQLDLSDTEGAAADAVPQQPQQPQQGRGSPGPLCTLLLRRMHRYVCGGTAPPAPASRQQDTAAHVNGAGLRMQQTERCALAAAYALMCREAGWLQEMRAFVLDMLSLCTAQAGIFSSLAPHPHLGAGQAAGPASVPNPQTAPALPDLPVSGVTMLAPLYSAVSQWPEACAPMVLVSTAAAAGDVGQGMCSQQGVGEAAGERVQGGAEDPIGAALHVALLHVFHLLAAAQVQRRVSVSGKARSPTPPPARRVPSIHLPPLPLPLPLPPLAGEPNLPTASAAVSLASDSLSGSTNLEDEWQLCQRIARCGVTLLSRRQVERPLCPGHEGATGRVQEGLADQAAPGGVTWGAMGAAGPLTDERFRICCAGLLQVVRWGLGCPEGGAARGAPARAGGSDDGDCLAVGAAAVHQAGCTLALLCRCGGLVQTYERVIREMLSWLPALPLQQQVSIVTLAGKLSGSCLAGRSAFAAEARACLLLGEALVAGMEGASQQGGMGGQAGGTGSDRDQDGKGGEGVHGQSKHLPELQHACAGAAVVCLAGVMDCASDEGEEGVEGEYGGEVGARTLALLQRVHAWALRGGLSWRLVPPEAQAVLRILLSMHK